ncbi:NAD-dependent protein deacetylase srt2 [Entomophthora muscae]|uniref:NAD-dependent protein deacetylase srt2 n=1 Tax=Entomophthora muscae TaxID=34485 RepID=A0ACC2UEN3_9FUNG|nr:NAD-dependent protein deacetylase srt2 [Entomophthora muscae]
MSTFAQVSSPKINLDSVKKLVDLFSKFKNEGGVTIISGAGISTDSGIPDYRGSKGAYTLTPNFKPITYQDFISSEGKQKRYWARSFFGYQKFSLAKPNVSHLSIAELEKLSYVNHIITQNVDALHHQAGSKRITEIHGSLKTVSCIACNLSIERKGFQKNLELLNPLWSQYLQAHLQRGSTNFQTTPDGDIQLPDNTPYSEFKVPKCKSCNGILKPDVVFFGENMSHKVRLESSDIIDKASAVLVVGSSLATPSAYRLVVKAVTMNRPAYILNVGKTRADDLATHLINQECTPTLVSVLNELKTKT